MVRQTPGQRLLPGGPLLQPEHFEPEHVPIEVSRYGRDPHTLVVGSPGKVGVLQLDFEVRGAGTGQRTELVHHYQKSPLQIFKPLYFNPLRPDMPYTYILTTGGGILHNDRQRMDLTFGPETSAHVTTQAHTKVYRMESGYATSVVNLSVAPGAYVEFLPDPVIPYIDSRMYQRLAVTLAESGTLVAGETIYAGRLSRGERNAYAVYASDFEVRRPDGAPVAVDRVRLVPQNGRAGGIAVLGGHDIVCSIYVFTSAVTASEIAETLHAAATTALKSRGDDSSRAGVSVLPGDAGAWLRLVSDDTITTTEVQRTVTAALHERLTGRRAPVIRK